MKGRPRKVPRSHHAAVLLETGKVLVVGGATSEVDAQSGVARATSSAELFDPGTGAWAEVAPMKAPRFLPQATLLADGKVLVTGGGDERWNTIAQTELYDPAANSWRTVATPASAGRIYHGAARLASGNVFIACGRTWTPNDVWRSDAEFYDPTKDQWFPAGGTGSSRTAPVVVGLGEHLLVAGGQSRQGNDFPLLDDARVYDETTGQWAAGPALAYGRLAAASVLLPSGDILVCGGFSEEGGENTCELSSH
ncbi:MAG: hypothetical protein HY901_25365 [Deltaproteobacteria bacterium]|nr:hypothetical protein [Deltaproteobacteria bacterium]